MERACRRGGIRKSFGKVFGERRKIIEEKSKPAPLKPKRAAHCEIVYRKKG
jgi:hypothetical protein